MLSESKKGDFTFKHITLIYYIIYRVFRNELLIV